MNWKPRAYWAFLALATAVLAWRLTVLITHVDRSATSTIEVLYDGLPQPLPRQSPGDLTLSGVQEERFRIPGLVISSTEHAVLIVSPQTRSFTFANISPNEVSCAFSDRVFVASPPALLVEEARKEQLHPVPVSLTAAGGTGIVVPQPLHAALVRAHGAQGTIECASSRQLAGSPTFTERSLTAHVNGLKGPFLFDVSALEDIDNLRFSGGVAFPLAGDRTRFLGPNDNLVSVEWVEVSAAERRDIVLVIVGALAAIAAAMAIEAIRPFIEREPA